MQAMDQDHEHALAQQQNAQAMSQASDQAHQMESESKTSTPSASNRSLRRRDPIKSSVPGPACSLPIPMGRWFSYRPSGKPTLSRSDPARRFRLASNQPSHQIGMAQVQQHLPTELLN